MTDTPVPTDQTSHRALRLAVGAAAVVVLMLGVAQLSDIVGPFFLALNLMIVVWPVQRVLARRLPRPVASVLAGLVAIVILVIFFWAIGWAASVFVAEVPLYRDQFQGLYDQALNLLAEVGVTSSQILDQLKSINTGSVVSVVGSLLSNVSGIVTLLVVVVSVVLFMTVDSMQFEERLQRLGQRHNPVLVLALQSFAQGVRRYWVTSTVFGLIVAVLTGTGLAVYGVPLAFVWAVLSFVTNYIPNIGFVIGLIPATVMGFLAKGPIGALVVVVMYVVINFVIQSVIQPKVAGEAVGVTSTVSFVSLLVWAVVLGPLGALLALPATLFVKALVVDADPRARWVNALIASNPRTSAEEPLIASEEVDNVDPLVPQPAPNPTSEAGSADSPRRASEESDEALDEVRPRREAVDAADARELAADAESAGGDLVDSAGRRPGSPSARGDAPDGEELVATHAVADASDAAAPEGPDTPDGTSVASRSALAVGTSSEPLATSDDAASDTSHDGIAPTAGSPSDRTATSVEEAASASESPELENVGSEPPGSDAAQDGTAGSGADAYGPVEAGGSASGGTFDADTGPATGVAPGSEAAGDVADVSVAAPGSEASVAVTDLTRPADQVAAGTGLAETAVHLAEPRDDVVPGSGAAIDTDETQTPRRARLDGAPRDEEDVVTPDWPVFQKSATPYWQGTSHPDAD